MSDVNRSSDEYYRNRRPGSPFAQSAADSTRKPRQKLPPGYSPVATPRFDRDDTTTNKYYAEGGSKTGGAGQPMAPRRVPAGRTDPAVAAGSYGVVCVEIPDVKALGEGVAAAKQAARAGAKVEVAVTDKDLIARIATALDGAVSREEITEDQRREIRVGVKLQTYQTADRRTMPAENRSPDEVFGAPVASLREAPPAPDTDLDIDAFLSGGAVDDEDEKHAALTGGTAQGGAPPAPPRVDVEPEDNDFLAPDPAAAEVDRMILADIKALAPDLSKVPQQPKAAESK